MRVVGKGKLKHFKYWGLPNSNIDLCIRKESQPMLLWEEKCGLLSTPHVPWHDALSWELSEQVMTSHSSQLRAQRFTTSPGAMWLPLSLGCLESLCL